MDRRLIYLLVFLICVIAAIIFGLQAWREATHPTVVVEWSTSSELNTAGYNLYRSDQPDGDYIRINENLIPASPDPLTGGDYQYLDESVELNRTYYFMLEDVDVEGRITRHGPIETKTQRGGLVDALLAVLLGIIGISALVLARRESQGKYQQSVKGKIDNLPK